MPMIDLQDDKGKVRWINVLPFSSLKLARSYVKNSAVPLRIVKGGPSTYWVCNPEDASWAVTCGYEEIKKAE